MADYPERTVTAQTNMAEYERAMRVEKLRKKYGNMMWNVSALRGRGWASSSAARQWKSAINSGGSSLTGLSTRLKMMKDADKEFVGNQLTGNFQNWLTENPDATIGLFNEWANDQGPWYEAERRAKDQKVVKDRLDAMKNTKVAEAVDTLFGEYNDEWATGSYAEQNQVRQNIADSDAIKNLPSKWRASAVDEVIKMLNSFLSPTGQYAADIEARRVLSATEATEKHTAAISKTATDKSKNLIASNISTDAAACVLAGDGSPEAREDCFQEATAKWAKTFPDVVSLISEDARKRFNAAVEKPTAPPGTKPVYNPATDSTIFATDAEIEDDDSLVPTAAESNLDSTYAHIGAFMAINGDIPNEVWKKYYKGGMNLLYNSLGGEDKEHLLKWLKKVDEYRAKAVAKPTFEMSLLYGGPATGQTDDGLSNPRLKQTD